MDKVTTLEWIIAAVIVSAYVLTSLAAARFYTLYKRADQARCKATRNSWAWRLKAEKWRALLGAQTMAERSLHKQLQAATELLEEKDNQLTRYTSLVQDMRNDFASFDAAFNFAVDELVEYKLREQQAQDDPPF